MKTRKNSVTPETFWARTRKDGDCTVWTGSVNTYGYGQVRYKGKQIVVSRLSWMWANGPIPAGLNVCHTCDNPACVNAAHLFLGTVKDNSMDMVQKGRSLKGVRHPLAKLTDMAVLEARRRRERGETFVAIAKDFGVTPEAISYACNGGTWRHI